MEGASSNSVRSVKTVRFALGKGNKNDGKLVVVHKNTLADTHDEPVKSLSKSIRDKKRMPSFIEETLLGEDFLGSKPPKVLLSVTGAAGSYVMNAQIEQMFCQGLVNAAKSTTAWIVSGGTDVGVMHYVGEAIRKLVTDVPTIGFATYNMINNKHVLKAPERTVEYDPTASALPNTVNLNANHSHFVLVESNADKWGEEIEARSDFEEYMCEKFDLPLCLIVVNGGPGTLKTVAEGVARSFPVVILEGTGRAADAIAREIRRERKQPYEHLDAMELNKEALEHLHTIIAHEALVTIYKSDSGPLDLEILKAILRSSRSSFLPKLNLAIEWNRIDLAEHLLDPANKDRPSSPEEFTRMISAGMVTALDLERPELFRLLANKGARKADINLSVLYTSKTDVGGTELDPVIARYIPHLRAIGGGRAPSLIRGQSVTVSTTTPLLASGLQSPIPMNISKLDLDIIKVLFKTVNPVFSTYADNLATKFSSTDSKAAIDASAEITEVSMKEMPFDGESSKSRYTDAVLWAILKGRMELAKAIWERTTLPVHTALVASGLCKGVAEWLLNEKQTFEDAAAWFEEVAVKFLDQMDYNDAKTLLTYDWDEFGLNALEIAVQAECKDFTAHSHVQRWLDEKLYRDVHGGIPLGTNFLKVILCVIMPFFLYITHTYDHVVSDNKPNAYGRWYHFYNLPYTKFWTNTFCYIGYLVLLAVVLVGYQDTPSLSPAEIVLWIWILGYAIEELSQWRAEGATYFKYVSNRMDIFILILQAFYVAFSIAAAARDDSDLLKASTDILIVTTIISYVRMLDVFSISKDLGPLYFVLQKIIKDVFRWIFVFVLFAIGFQVSFMALTAQLGATNSGSGSTSASPGEWTPTYEGGSFMGAFYTIIGDWDSTMQVVKESQFAVIIVSIYALIAQIMLVNLLIAMMGDTFNSVKENSDKEWKYSRYDLVVEYTSTSFHPPPFNLVIIPFKNLVALLTGKLHVNAIPPLSEKLSKKQRDQFKNLMRNMKDSFLEETAAEEQRTIGAVSDLARDSFKALQDDQAIKFRSIEQKIGDLALKTQQISVGGGGASSASNNNSLRMDIDSVEQHLNTLVKNEISLLQKNLLEAITHQKPKESVPLLIQNNTVPLTWAEGIKVDVIQKITKEYKPFLEWVDSMNKPENIKNLKVRGVNMKSVDMFGPRIGFVKFDVEVVNEGGERVPGLVFMRGGAVGMLMILKVDDESSTDHGKEFTILTIQPRVPAGESRFAEIPAGMIDGASFVGAAAKEIKEEVGLEIKEEELLDLTGLTYNGAHKGVYPSAGGCDEFLRLFVYRTRVNAATLHGYRDRLTGELIEGEKITLKVIPLGDLWFEAPDAKALSALMLYNTLIAKGIISAEF